MSMVAKFNARRQNKSEKITVYDFHCKKKSQTLVDIFEDEFLLGVGVDSKDPRSQNVNFLMKILKKDWPCLYFMNF